MRRPSNVAAILAVLAVYVFFATAGSFRFHLVDWSGSYYASLAEGFRHGRLSMMEQPGAELKALDDPYDPDDRENVPYLWDASFYNGRYYLYFSPVPVVFFDLPFRVIAGAYPPDGLAATLFSAIAFLFCAAFTARVLRDTKTRVPLWLWTLLIGLGNVLAYVLVNVRVYEVAVTAAMMFTAAWAYALLREKPLWAGICLALAIATRPNTIVLVAITAVALWRNRKAMLAAAIPLVVVAAVLMTYNAARFGSPFELGTTYQLTAIDMHGEHVCCLCRPAEVMRFVNSASEYLFAAPMFETRFPFALFPFNRLDPRVSYPGTPERVAGVAPIAPLAIVGTLFALIVPRREDDRVARIVLAGAWLVLAGLSTCWWVVARYSLDFMLLMTTSAIVFIERALEAFPSRALRILVIALACFSIVVAVLLGFDDTFGRMNSEFPALFRWKLI